MAQDDVLLRMVDITKEFPGVKALDKVHLEVKRGTGGAAVVKPLEEITFLDVYQAVECIEENTLFHFHENPNMNCPVGKNIHNILDDKLLRVQEAMEKELKAITLADVMKDLNKYV